MRTSWLAIVSDGTARAIARSEWRLLPLASIPASAAAGDRVAIVLAQRVRAATTAVVLGTADVRQRDAVTHLSIRHRVVAPAGHEPMLTDQRQLLASVGWTDERVRAALGGILPVPQRAFDDVEHALREVALAFGPPPKRREHARPRTPGRRALASDRVVARRRPG